MQGGRSDNSVLGSWGGKFDVRASSEGESSGYESEVEITSRISLGYTFDAVLHSLRTFFAVSISLPVAWMCLHPTIGSFRARKFRMVDKGTKTVVWVQKKLRSRLGDYYFGFFSFCAEEEFYLLLLPFLIWNVDHILGRRVTLIVCIGLVLGNTMKDVFGLPRPPSPPVWRPAHQEAIDSTNLQDFGFPSTHAMNAVSNSAFTFLYLTSTPSTFNVQDILSDRKNALMFAFVILYISSLCLSRLYLGAHTPTDLRGGLSLGVILTATYWASSEVIDSYYLSTPNLLLKLIFTGMITLLLMPQPRPVTPTFSQNALLCGLITGCCYGSRQYVDLKSISFHGNAIITGDGMTFSLPEYVPVDLVRSIFLAWNPYLRTFIRTIFGYIVVLLLRVVAKSVSTMILSCVGISVKPHIDRQMSRQRRRKKLRVVRLFTRDIDIVGSAIVKMFTYSVLAWAITFFVPFLDCVLGLLEYEQNQLI